MSVTERVPTQSDWGRLPVEDLDVRAAYEDFFGKTNQEMAPQFAQSVIAMADSLRWMPKIPFLYYMKGFAEFVMFGEFHSMNAPDIASSFLNLVEEKARDAPDAFPLIEEVVLEAVKHLSERQVQYGADVAIYGDFKERRKVIESLLSRT